MTFVKCAACKRNGAKILSGDKVFCEDCAKAFGTCVMCVHSKKCGFNTNPAPIPKFVTKRIREETNMGYMEQIVQMPNAQRIKAFCIEDECKCMGYVGEEPKCMRQFGTCANYLEHEF
jgi:hypothetical protein